MILWTLPLSCQYIVCIPPCIFYITLYRSQIKTSLSLLHLVQSNLLIPCCFVESNLVMQWLPSVSLPVFKAYLAQLPNLVLEDLLPSPACHIRSTDKEISQLYLTGAVSPKLRWNNDSKCPVRTF